MIEFAHRKKTLMTYKNNLDKYKTAALNWNKFYFATHSLDYGNAEMLHRSLVLGIRFGLMAYRPLLVI